MPTRYQRNQIYKSIDVCSYWQTTGYYYILCLLHCIVLYSVLCLCSRIAYACEVAGPARAGSHLVRFYQCIMWQLQYHLKKKQLDFSNSDVSRCAKLNNLMIFQYFLFSSLIFWKSWQKLLNLTSRCISKLGLVKKQPIQCVIIFSICEIKLEHSRKYSSLSLSSHISTYLSTFEFVRTFTGSTYGFPIYLS